MEREHNINVFFTVTLHDCAAVQPRQQRSLTGHAIPLHSDEERARLGPPLVTAWLPAFHSSASPAPAPATAAAAAAPASARQCRGSAAAQEGAARNRAQVQAQWRRLQSSITCSAVPPMCVKRWEWSPFWASCVHACMHACMHACGVCVVKYSRSHVTACRA